MPTLTIKKEISTCDICNSKVEITKFDSIKTIECKTCDETYQFCLYCNVELINGKCLCNFLQSQIQY